MEFNMKIKIIEGVKLPRLVTIPGLTIEQYRALQSGQQIDVDESVAGQLKKYTESEGGNG